MRRVWKLMLLCAGLARSDTFLIRSTDGGRNWSDIDPGPPHHTLLDLQQGAAATLYALTRAWDGQYRVVASSDGGQSWQTLERFATGGSDVFADAVRMAVSPARPDTIYVIRSGSEGITIIKSADGGKTVEEYTAAGFPYTVRVVWQFVAAASPSSTLFVSVAQYGSDDGDLFFSTFRSVDGGRNWTRVGGYSSPFRHLMADPFDPSTVYGFDFFSFCKSADGGDSWVCRLADANAVALDPRNPGVLLAVRADGTIWKSTDRAETWRLWGHLPAPANAAEPFWVQALNIKQANPVVVYAEAGSQVLKSEDGGQSWMAPFALPEMMSLAGALGGPAYSLHSADYSPLDTLYAFARGRGQVRLHRRQTFVRNLTGGAGIAPGGIVSILGEDLAPELLRAGAAPLPAALGGASVRFNDRPAPLFFVSPGEIRAQIPFGLEGPVTLEVRAVPKRLPRARGGIQAPPLDRQTVTIVPSAPVVLTDNTSGPARPQIFHGADFHRVDEDSPARPGEVITLFCAGLGEVRPAMVAGALPPSPPPEVVAPFTVSIEEFLTHYGVVPPFPVRWAGAAPDLVGVYHVNVELPQSLRPGAYWLTLSSGPYDYFIVRLDVR